MNAGIHRIHNLDIGKRGAFGPTPATRKTIPATNISRMGGHTRNDVRQCNAPKSGTLSVIAMERDHQPGAINRACCTRASC